MNSTPFDFRNKVAIVTGGSRGIGRAIAELLLESGCAVTVCGRNPPDELPRAGALTADFLSCNVRDAAAVKQLVNHVAEVHGRVDLLVNNAGGSPTVAAADAPPRYSAAIIELNLLGPLYAAQAANVVMQTQAEGGSIINISSVSGTRPSPGTAAYGAAKAGLLNLTQSLAMEWGPKVRVNAIVTGLVATESAIASSYGVEGAATIGAMFPLKRLAVGADIASTVLYLASPFASYVSGACLAVHGGGERPFFLDFASPAAAGRS